VDIGNSVERGFTEFFAWLPALLGALAILVIGYFVAKAVSGLVWRGLHRAGFDRTLHAGQGGSFVQKLTSSPSRLVGTIAFWAILLGTVSLAVSVLGIEALTDFVAAIYGYLPNVLAAVLIFLVASAISAGLATLAARTMGGTALGKIVATAAPILVMTIATFMILDQLMIAETIVTITYAALLGAIALGTALAFGLGGREVAREMLQGAYEKGQENKEQFRQDLDQGLSRAREEASSMKESFSGSDGAGSEDDLSTRRMEPVLPRSGGASVGSSSIGGSAVGSPPLESAPLHSAPITDTDEFQGDAIEPAYEPAHDLNRTDPDRTDV
jgi:Conserved TM helix